MDLCRAGTVPWAVVLGSFRNDGVVIAASVGSEPVHAGDSQAAGIQ